MIKIDPEGGNPSGAPDIPCNSKQANDAPESVSLPGPDANTPGAVQALGKGAK